MSSSLFDNCGYLSAPHSFLEYNEGDVKFEDLKPGDILYYHTMDYAQSDKLDIYEVTVASGVILKGEEAYINIKPIPMYEGQRKKYQTTKLSFGPSHASGSLMFGNDLKYYDSDDIKTSSICANPGNLVIIGTNKEVVERYASKGIELKIEAMKKNINDLITKMNFLESKIK